MKIINKNTEKDKKDTIYNVSKIIKYCSIKYIKCFKMYQHVITTSIYFLPSSPFLFSKHSNTMFCY